MTDCGSFEPLVAGYVDGELGPADLGRVQVHLATCASCRSLAEAERQVREQLRAKAHLLREEAPASLRASLTRRQTVVPFARRPERSPAWRWIPLPAAAALVIALSGIVAIGALAPRGSALAAQLTVDHLKCKLLASKDARPEPSAVAAAWEAHRRWHIEVPPSAPDGHLELIALRRCLFSDGEMAHLVYLKDGRAVSVFILPHERPSAPELEIMGHETVTWSRDGRTYAVVGDMPAADLQRVAAYIQPRVR